MLRWLLEKLRLANRSTREAGERRAHPMNVPGPLYVEEGCCLACGVWEEEGAGLLAWDNSESYPQCYVARQPESDEDYHKVAGILAIQEVDCIRVRDCPARLREILRAAGQKYYIDS